MRLDRLKLKGNLVWPAIGNPVKEPFRQVTKSSLARKSIREDRARCQGSFVRRSYTGQTQLVVESQIITAPLMLNGQLPKCKGNQPF